jgi:hypothetical protein
VAQISGVAVASVGLGAVFLYSAITGKSALGQLRAVVSGQSPATAQQTNPINPDASAADQDNTTQSNAPSGGSVQEIFRNAAKAHGWDTGSNWTSLQNIEENEAGYSPTVKNSSSGALGIAQALGHGTANTGGTLGNEYGGFGLSDAEARAANSGDPRWQSVWMMNYIASRYGNPNNAWAQYHHPDGSKWY